MTYIAIVLSILLLYGPAAADDPPAPANEPPAGTTPAPASPDEPAASPDPAPASPSGPVAAPAPASPSEPVDDPAPTAASPSEPPTSVRPDFATVKKSLVIVRDGPDNAAKQVPGFGISDQGHIVTYAGPLRDQQSYQVSNAEGQVFSADRLVADEETGLMILNLSGSGHGVTALKFAKTALQAAAPLRAVTFSPSGPEPFTPKRGTVTRLLTEDGSQIITHNALFSKESAGTPLLNRCYEAVGVNVLERQGLFQRERAPTEQGIARSLAAASLSRLLASVGLALPMAETECLSLEEETRQAEQARQEQEARRQQERAAAEREAQERAAALQQEKEAAEQKAAALQQEKEAAERAAQERAAALQRERTAAEQLAQEKAAAEREAQEKQAALQQERTAAEQQAREAGQRERQTLLYASIAGGVLLLGIVAAVWSKRRRLRHAEEEKLQLSGSVDRMQSELSEAAARDQLRSSAPDVFLEGSTPPIALKIPGASLVEPGALIGRSPAESTFVINHEQISRRHFRLSLVAQQIMLEDLGSTNGTSIDGVAVEAGKQTPVRDGSRLALGDLKLTLHIGK